MSRASEGWMGKKIQSSRHQEDGISSYIHIPRAALSSGQEHLDAQHSGMVWAQQREGHGDPRAGMRWSEFTEKAWYPPMLFACFVWIVAP